MEYSKAIDELRQRVCLTFGKEITKARDCDILAKIISDKRQRNISPQTLRRFFGIIKNAAVPQVYTLDSFSIYCGFTSFENFKSIQSNKDLISFFGKDDSSENYCSKAEELCNRVMSSPKFLITTHHQLMEFPKVRKFFLEHYPIRCMLGTVYSQYFLAYLKYNTSDEAKIFAYGFLFKSAFLQENEELIHLYYSKIKDIEVTTDIFVVPAGLKFGVELLYLDYTKNEKGFKKAFNDMKLTREKFIPYSQKSACSFEYSVLELLIFTKRSKEMKFLVDNNTYQIYADREFVSEERKRTHNEVWKILCAITYQKLGDKEKCTQYLASINLDNLGIGWYKYYSILYYLLCIQNPEVSVNTDAYSIFINLVDETYFYYYKTVLNSVYKNDKSRNMIKKINS